MKRVVRRRLQEAGAVAALLVLVVGYVSAPRILRHMDVFAVETVEVTGTRFLEPYAVVRAAGLDRPANLFDDPDTWRAGVLTLPLVADVSFRRQVPGTVQMVVREVEPLALVADGPLRPADVSGRILELEPAGVVLDLPVILGARIRAGRVDSAGSYAIATVAALMARAPELADRISQVAVGSRSLRITFREAGMEAILSPRPTEVQLLQLRLAHADLRSRGELDQVRRIDVRFRDQVVVSFLDAPVS